MPTILQLGAGELMRHSIRQIQELGYKVYAIDKNPNAPAFSIADGFAPIDLVDTDGIIAYAREIGADAILAINEAGVLSAAKASQALGLRGLSPETAIKALDKGMMRDAWASANLPQPTYRIADDEAGLRAAVEAIGYPLIIKPTMNWGSRGISSVADESELDWAVDFALKHQRNGRLIAEQLVTGTECTVEGLMRDGEVAVLAKSDKAHQAHPRFKVAMELNYPANFAPEILTKSDDIFTRAAYALGIDNCAIHAEVMIQGDDVYLIEMGARPGGGHIFGQIVEAASGVNMPQTLTKILLGEDVDIQPKYQRGASYHFFVPPQGIFISADGVDEAKQMTGILDFGFHMATGTHVNPIEGDADRPGYCVSSGATRDEARNNARAAIGSIRYTMETP